MEKLKDLVFSRSVDTPLFFDPVVTCFKMPVLFGASRQYGLAHGRQPEGWVK